MKKTFKKIAGLIILTALIFISGCDNNKSLKTGILEGVISIGPLCPVERIPPDPACLPTAETYKAYQVDVYTRNGKTRITQLTPALDGSYSSELPPGDYVVMLENAVNSIGGSNLPAEVLINSDDKTVLNINIDTGIR